MSCLTPISEYQYRFDSFAHFDNFYFSKQKERRKKKKRTHISLAKVYLGSKDEWLRPHLIHKVFFIVIKPDMRVDPAND